MLRPALATLLLHGVMIYLMTANWAEQDREVVRVKPAPKVINARLVDVSEFRPKPKPKPKPKATQARPNPNRWPRRNPSPNR